MRIETSLIVLTLALSSCSNWPSDAEALRSRFLENRNEFEMLATMLQESDFESVEVIRGSDALFASETDANGVGFVQSEQASTWVDLLRRTNTRRLFAIDRDSAVQFNQLSNAFDDDSLWVVAIVREEHRTDLLIECELNFRELSCGKCGWRLEERWSLIYSWQPRNILPDEDERYLSGDLSLDDFMALENDAMRSCRIEGHSAIGYDVSGY